MRKLEDLIVMLNLWEKSTLPGEGSNEGTDELKLIGNSCFNVIHFLQSGVT